jgi:hypothetical protein
MGLFGTNDVPCPHCKRCYRAVTKEVLMKARRRERNQRLGALEPPGSYGCCWKDLPEPNPNYLRCDLPIDHEGPCRAARDIGELLDLVEEQYKQEREHIREKCRVT